MRGLLICLSLIASPVLAHDHWINQGKYKVPGEVVGCCGPENCKIVHASRIPPVYHIEETGDDIPEVEAQQGRDGNYWLCTITIADGDRATKIRHGRCFFIPIRKEIS